jgi:hypothetical protein
MTEQFQNPIEEKEATIDNPSTQSWPLTFMTWYRPFNKRSDAILFLWVSRDVKKKAES